MHQLRLKGIIEMYIGQVLDEKQIDGQYLTGVERALLMRTADDAAKKVIDMLQNIEERYTECKEKDRLVWNP